MTEATQHAQTGRIFEIQRFSIHDGPGIRTTVFLKACTLRCLWCHNPEGVAPEKLLSFLPDKCIACGYCFRTCSRLAHQMDAEAGHVLLREKCEVCGACTEQCYAGALEIVGRDVTVDDVLQEVLADEPFYETSGGGMTLSGGEPLMQIDFAEALLRAGKARGLHNVVETCGHVAYGRIRRVLPYVDLFLYDIKETDPKRHEEFTGAPNDLVLANLRKLHDTGATVLIRLPIVPGLNDRADHFQAVADLARSMPDLQGVEVMPYHRLGTSKLGRFGADPSAMPDVPSPDKETVAGWIAQLRDLGAPVLNGQS